MKHSAICHKNYTICDKDDCSCGKSKCCIANITENGICAACGKFAECVQYKDNCDHQADIGTGRCSKCGCAFIGVT